MPCVRLIRIPQNESVNSALHSGVVDLLPAQIAENELVKWVVAFDDVTKKIQDKVDLHDRAERLSDHAAIFAKLHFFPQ